MTLRFTDRTDLRAVVELAAGREVRTLQLGEFTDFSLTIIEERRKSTTAYLKSLGRLPQRVTAARRGTNFAHMDLGAISLAAIRLDEAGRFQIAAFLVPLGFGIG